MRLRFGHRRAGVAQPRGTTIVLLPGRAEFIEKYGETLDRLDELRASPRPFSTGAARAAPIAIWACLCVDYVPQVEDYLADLVAVMDRVDQLRLPRPLLDAGTLDGRACRAALSARPAEVFAAAVMSAPMFGIDLRAMPEPMARAICRVAIALGASRAYAPGQSDFDLDRRRFERQRADLLPRPFRHPAPASGECSGTGPGRGDLWLAGCGAALDRLDAAARLLRESITTPILVCQARAERIVSNRAQLMVVRRLPRARLEVFDDARHELLYEREPIRHQVFAAMDAFIAEVAA